MELDEFGAELAAAQQRVRALREESGELPLHRLALQLAFAELDTNLEELRVVDEELHAQQQELLETQQALEVQQRRYKALFDEAPDGYLVTTLAGTIEAANNAAGQLLNLHPQFLVGLPFALFVQREDQTRYSHELRMLRKPEWRTELNMRLKQHRGTLIDVAITATAERDARGNAVALRWMLRDCTARRQAEEQMRQLQAELEQRVNQRTIELTATNNALVKLNAENRTLLMREQEARLEAEAAVQQRDAFLSIAAHDLRAPLANILGFAQLLQQFAAKKGSQNDQEQRILVVLNQQTDRVSNLIDNLLDLNRLQSGQLTIQMETIDLAEIVQRVVVPLRLTSSEHTIEVAIPQEPVLLTADPLRIEQVLQNLISNAIKYSPAGGTITVELEHQTDQICLVVSDQGIGIPAADHAQLFQPFYRAGNVHRSNLIGFGIGLYIVHEIVTAHGGSIELTSAEGEGSTFTVCLPSTPLDHGPGQA